MQSVKIIQDTTLLILSKNDIHAGDIGHRARLKLSVAACNHNISIGILTYYLVDSLTALLIGHLSNRAGIDNADIGFLTLYSLMRASLYQLLHNGGCLREVELASQSVERGTAAL